MKKQWFWILIAALFLTAGTTHAEDDGVDTRTFEAIHGFYSCELPAWGWETTVLDEEMDETREYFLQLTNKANPSVTIEVTYFTSEAASFAGYDDFIQRNTRNALGETRSPRETYGPAEPVVNSLGIKAFRIERQRLVYLHLESKSEESMDLKEKLYVIPGEDGFFVLHYSSPDYEFDFHTPDFERVFESFKPGKRPEGFPVIKDEEE